jgi:long-chain acyl-CoA synthetase
MYGQTETSCLVSIGRYNDRPGSAGKTILLGDVRLVDDHDHAVAPGEVGEITLKGPMVFKGYWGLPEDNEYCFRNGRHHTGDLGRFDAGGFLFYAGRKAEKELIKPGGENVYPAEVEKIILQHAAVEQTVVIGVPDPKWKEGIKAVCLLKKGAVLEASELIEFVGARIARFKKPQYVEFVSELPLKKDGSIDRQEVKRMYGQT